MSETKDFNPKLSTIHNKRFEASIEMPVVGVVTVNGTSVAEAKTRLWLVLVAVKMLQNVPRIDPKDWTADEWRSALELMSKVAS